MEEVREQVFIWDLMNLEIKRAEELIKKFDATVKKQVYYDKVIKLLDIEGEKAFLAYLLGRRIVKDELMKHTDTMVKGMRDKGLL